MLEKTADREGKHLAETLLHTFLRRRKRFPIQGLVGSTCLSGKVPRTKICKKKKRGKKGKAQKGDRRRG